MENNILFVDMTVRFLPVISAVAQQGFTPILLGSITKRARRAGIRCHDFFEFAPDDLEGESARKTVEISAGLAQASGRENAKNAFASPLGNFMHHTGVAFFERFLEIAADEIEISICFRELLKKHDLDLMVLRTEKLSYERTLIQIAAQRGIPTLHVAHALWSSVGNGNIAGEYDCGLDSDYISVFGKRAYDGIVNCGIDPERILITGSPYWDEFYTNFLKNGVKIHQIWS